jgi:8-oxo-dGTP pyrophosphatase MutT (NUDIX family)
MADAGPAQDEGELFDVYDRAGAPLGRARPRGEVHRDGDWHRSLHLWVWGLVDGQPWVVLQRRSAGKDTHPRRLDVAVTGHLRAGESVADALREAEEEIGLRVGPAEVVRLGLRRREDRSRPGVIDRELQDILVAAAPVAIAALRPHPAELEALVAVPLADAARVLQDGAEAPGLRLADGQLVTDTVRGRELVPAPDGYYGRALASVAEVIAGGRPEAWALG